MSVGTISGLSAVALTMLGSWLVYLAVEEISTAKAVAGIACLVLAALAVLRALRDM